MLLKMTTGYGKLNTKQIIRYILTEQQASVKSDYPTAKEWNELIKNKEGILSDKLLLVSPRKADTGSSFILKDGTIMKGTKGRHHSEIICNLLVSQDIAFDDFTPSLVELEAKFHSLAGTIRIHSYDKSEIVYTLFGKVTFEQMNTIKEIYQTHPKYMKYYWDYPSKNLSGDSYDSLEYVIEDENLLESIETFKLPNTKDEWNVLVKEKFPEVSVNSGADCCFILRDGTMVKLSSSLGHAATIIALLDLMGSSKDEFIGKEYLQKYNYDIMSVKSLFIHRSGIIRYMGTSYNPVPALEMPEKITFEQLATIEKIADTHPKFEWAIQLNIFLFNQMGNGYDELIQSIEDENLLENIKELESPLIFCCTCQGHSFQYLGLSIKEAEQIILDGKEISEEDFYSIANIEMDEEIVIEEARDYAQRFPDIYGTHGIDGVEFGYNEKVQIAWFYTVYNNIHYFYTYK